MTLTSYAMSYKSDMFEIKKTNQFMDSINFVVIKNYEFRDIVKTEKVGPGSLFHDMVQYFTCI